MLQLLGDGYKLVPAADADAEKPREGVYHFDGVGVSALFAHPGDGVEGVVEEVGVYLSLQGLQLRLAEVYFLLADGGHELLDAQDHVLEGVGELLDLPRAADGAIGEVVGVGLEALHGVSEAAQGPAQQLREQKAREQRDAEHHGGKPEGEPYHLVDVPVHKLVHVADADDAPAAVADAVEAVDDGVVGPRRRR